MVIKISYSQSFEDSETKERNCTNCYDVHDPKPKFCSHKFVKILNATPNPPHVATHGKHSIHSQ